MKTFFIFCAALLITASLAFAGPGHDHSKMEDLTVPQNADLAETKKADSVETKKAPAEKKIADLSFQSTKSGVKYFNIKEGIGNVCVMGTQLEAHYTLWFADENGEKQGKHYQSSKDNNGKPYPCKLGYQLIQGWSDGMVGMKEGGIRLLLVPSELGYGKRGRGPIKPNQDLIFEIEYVKFIK